jgi:tetratricopeptide (TPR) repeat protein
LSFTYPGVDNAAHIGGLLAGITCGVAFQKLSDFKVGWCWRDLAVTVAMAALFAGTLYKEESTIGQDKSMPAAILLRESVDSLQKNDLRRALSKLDSALALEPKNERALLLRSTFNLTLGHYPQALADTTAALAIDPSDATAFNQRACIYLAMGRYEDALNDARRAVELNPHLTPAMDSEAMALAYLGQMDQALAEINRTIDEDNGETGIYFYHRSTIYAAMGDREKAASDLALANKHIFALENWGEGAATAQASAQVLILSLPNA